jgi:hypothetical protein
MFSVYIFSISHIGSSTNTQFVGFHYDLYVHSPTNYTTRIDIKFKEREWNHYLKIQKVGQIPVEKILSCYVPPTQVERYGPYTAPYTDPLSGAEIRTVTSLKWDDLRPYFHSIRPRITMPKNGTVYGAVYYENTVVNRPILMM